MPEHVFGKNILEIGAREGTPQLQSRHREKFLQVGYTGIDLVEWEANPKLNIQITDVFHFSAEPETFDLILAVAVFEHISFECWEELFKRCRNWVKTGGYLVIIVPDNQLLGEYVNGQDYQTALGQLGKWGTNVNIHRVFSITPPVFEYFLPHCRVIRKKYQIKYRDQGESWLWACGRFVKRVLTFHPYVWQGILRKADYLQIIWQK